MSRESLFRIRPDLEGSNPFSHVRLVQPALDRNCVECHEEKGALDLSGKPGGRHGWSRSYENLAAKYGFYFHVTNGSIAMGAHGGSRTTPGAFGASASPLFAYLATEHYGVNPSEEDFHRVTLWLDANSEFYGAYEDTEAQSRGEVVAPALDRCGIVGSGLLPSTSLLASRSPIPHAPIPAACPLASRPDRLPCQSSSLATQPARLGGPKRSTPA